MKNKKSVLQYDEAVDIIKLIDNLVHSNNFVQFIKENIGREKDAKHIIQIFQYLPTEMTTQLHKGMTELLYSSFLQAKENEKKS